MKKQYFFENAKLLYDLFEIIPLMYGSLGLEYITDQSLNSDDIDILIPNVFLSEKWDELKTALMECGYALTDEREHTFKKNGISYSYASIEELELFAQIDLSDIEQKYNNQIKFKLLSLEQYLKVYTASSKDGYRINVRKKKDADKISFIQKHLKQTDEPQFNGVNDGEKLSEMTLEELWQLFPIVLTAHSRCWKEWYLNQEALLKKALPQIIRISHIGSTAIPSIWAKPIIDILVEIPEQSNLIIYKDLIVKSGYICMSESEKRLSFNKGYTENGFAERVFHLHLRYAGDNNELYFRDYLNEFPDVAKEYERLKLSLWKKYEHNRDAYTSAKTDFVAKYTEKAKILYGNRY